MTRFKPVLRMMAYKAKALIKIICLIIFLQGSTCMATTNERTLEGYNWYSERVEEDSKKQDPDQNQKKPDLDKKLDAEFDLPDYEKNIRSLKKLLRQAHRRALDNPSDENILAELLLEKEVMNKSKSYGEKRVAIASFMPEFLDLKGHSNVLHRSVQEQKENRENYHKLSKLSKEWGLILQVSDECMHCHVFAPIVLEFAKEYGFELLAASKHGREFEAIEGVIDSGQMLALNPMGATPMLYLLKNDGSEVLPVSRGINSADQIIRNINNIDKHIMRLF